MCLAPCLLMKDLVKSVFFVNLSKFGCRFSWTQKQLLISKTPCITPCLCDTWYICSKSFFRGGSNASPKFFFHVSVQVQCIWMSSVLFFMSFVTSAKGNANFLEVLSLLFLKASCFWKMVNLIENYLQIIILKLWYFFRNLEFL